MKQLKMIRGNISLPQQQLPEGYHYAFYKGTEQEIDDWLEICSNGLISDKNRAIFEKAITNHPDLVPEQDLFFVTDETGKRVATSAGIQKSNGDGYIHMVAALPECRSKGIGRAMLSFALSLLSDRGCHKIILTTDDHRLAAIKTYLDAGFKPVIYSDEQDDMKLRWDEVIKNLGYKKAVTYIKEL